MAVRRRENGLREEEYPSGSGIFIREVENRSGKKSFGISFMVIVPANLTGAARIRRNFKDRDKARAFAEENWKGKAARGAAYFSLNSQLQNEVAALVPVLQESGQTLDGIRQLLKVVKGASSKLPELASGLEKLSEGGLEFADVVPFASAHLATASSHRTLSFVVEEIIDLKKARPGKEKMARVSLEDFEYRARKLARELGPDKDLALVTRGDVFDWIKGLGLSARSNENYIRTAVAIFNHALAEGYVKYSPLSGLIGDRRKALVGTKDGKVDGDIGILTIDETIRLLNVAKDAEELGLFGFVVLCLFCGLRSEEAKKLDWSSVKPFEDKPTLTVSKDIAKKRRVRHVDIHPNAVEWLKFCCKEEGPVVEHRNKNHFDRKFRALRLKAGFAEKVKGKEVSHWKHNAMRHSYGSYHFDKFEDSVKTAVQMGHKTNDDELFNHYRELVRRGDGERYFSIVP